MKARAPKADAAPTRMLKKPTWLISRAFARSSRLLAEAFESVDARGYHYRLLAALEEFGACSQADLSRRTSIDRSDVVATLNELADGGLVRRSPDPEDRRRNIITITPAGIDRLRALERLVLGVQERLLGPLSASDRKRFVRLLTRVVEHHAQQ
jgi:DNA-binding MarR family transcriptional regulator